MICILMVRVDDVERWDEQYGDGHLVGPHVEEGGGERGARSVERSRRERPFSVVEDAVQFTPESDRWVSLRGAR
jgi:hypothetical protein